jgi:transposase
MRAISLEKRTMIVEAKQRKESVADISKWCNVGKDVIRNIWRQFTRTGSIEPLKHNGRPSRITVEIEEAIIQKIKKDPDATLEEIIDELNLPIKKSQLSNIIIKKGYTVKKNSTCKQCPKRGCCRKATRMAVNEAKLRYQ